MEVATRRSKHREACVYGSKSCITAEEEEKAAASETGFFFVVIAHCCSHLEDIFWSFLKRNVALA